MESLGKSLSKTLSEKIAENWTGEYCEVHTKVKVYNFGYKKICGECELNRIKAEAKGVRRQRCEELETYREVQKTNINEQGKYRRK